MTEIVEIPVEQIAAGNNDRKRFDPVKLEELAASIREHGLAQPITVRPLPVPDAYQIIAGERRFRAIAQVLLWPTAPCIVRIMSDEEAAATMLAENTGREDLDPIEEANAYQVRIQRFGWSVERLAEAAGVSPDLVKRRLSLLRLTDDAQRLVAFGHIPLGHAEAMTPLDHNRQRIALRIFQQSKGLTLAQFRHIVSELLAEQSQDALFSLESFWVEQVQQQEELPRRGKHAFTGAPIRSDLPSLQASQNDSAAAVIDRWISSLLENGFTEEAAVAGTLYENLVHMNYLAVPPSATLTHR
jgi:ParB/RepB/Spo0J family partition protein